MKITFWLSSHRIIFEPVENKVNIILGLVKIINTLLGRKIPSWRLVEISSPGYKFSPKCSSLPR